jgi:hypothetical protein
LRRDGDSGSRYRLDVRPVVSLTAGMAGTILAADEAVRSVRASGGSMVFGNAATNEGGLFGFRVASE